MRSIGVVTTSRADYGIYRPVLRAIAGDTALALRLFVSGTHLSGRHAMTVREIEADGFTPDARVPLPLESDAPKAIAAAMAAATQGFAGVFVRARPDILLVLGDRFEMHAAVVAALPFRIPVAHLHGGELTAGAMDDALRHSITKLSHVHLPATEEYAKRIAQMGEEPWRITVVGAPGLDNIRGFEPIGPGDLERIVGLPVTRDMLLVTFHPATLDEHGADTQVGEVIAALEAVSRPVVITMPNADPGGQAVRAQLEAFAARHPCVAVVENLGTAAYFGILAGAGAMVGNSSSGLIEAPSFGLPVVNVGPRQDGRARGANVIDVRCERAAIEAGIRRALVPAFRESIRGMTNPYGDGGASQRIVKRLRELELGPRLVQKRFVDAPARVTVA